MSLPRLKAGRNRLRLEWGDRHGLATEAMIVEPFLGDRRDAERWGVRVEGEYQPGDRTTRARGAVTMRVDPLEGTMVRWLHVGGSFNTRRPPGRSVPDRIAYATAPGGPWTTIREVVPPEWNDHWYYNAEADIVLDAPAERLWMRLEPATAVNAIRVYAHCEPEGAVQEGPLAVTHAYRIDGDLVKKTVSFDTPSAYEIDCSDEPENVYVKMAVPSRRRVRPASAE
jgi:hypothetical protein